MGRIVLNESIIRNIVRETLENLILGEDNYEMNIDEIIDILKGCDLKGVEECNVKNDAYGEIVLALSNNVDDDILLTLNFYVNGNRVPYNPGNNRDIAPEGGEYDINNIEVLNGIFYYEGLEHNIQNMDDEQKLYFNNLIENINEIRDASEENIEDFSEEDLY